MGDNDFLADLAERYFWQLSELFGHETLLKIPNNKIETDPSESLNSFQSQIRNCLKCPLGHVRKNFVFGAGNSKSDIVFVGEAPGRDEDLKGEPFVGKAGQLLDKILTAVKMTRNEVYICNIIKCRPPDNRTPYQIEIDLCLPYLEKQLKLISPKLIVAVFSFFNVVKKLLFELRNAQLTKFVSPKFSTFSLPDEMIDSINVEPHLGKPIIKIG